VRPVQSGHAPPARPRRLPEAIVTYRATVRGETFRFADLRAVMAAANEEKSGDQLAGLAAGSEQHRVAAKMVLADVTVGELVANPLVEDDITALVDDGLDHEALAPLRPLTMGELRERILDPGFAGVWPSWRGAITPEVAAAAAKLMGDKDLVLGASRLHTVTRCRNTMGEAGVLGVRVQPNHPADALPGVLLSALDGLRHGCGDAVIGINPAGDSVETVATLLTGLQDLVRTLEVPTQTCVLSHVTTQIEALRRGAPVDLLFQSVAGTEAANASFGVTMDLLADAREEVLAHHAGRRGEFVGTQVTYFETGQGSALSADAHAGVDQLTLEARAQAVARAFDPFLVNTVVGFIGPEYLADARQIIRAGLEDHFTGKLMGLPMGCDVCFTNHADADHNSNDDLLLLLVAAGCTFVMGVPGSDDVMLNYQSTSYQDAVAAREIFARRPAPEFEAWLERQGWWRDGALEAGDPDPRTLRGALAALQPAP
jgi:ethanolamine ammonia-lyase large subunit